MNVVAFFLALLLLLNTASMVNGSIASPSTATALRTAIRRVGGCPANICFAIDGSGSLNSTAFRNEQDFVLDVVSIVGVDDPGEYAAVQYSTSNINITPLTRNTDLFNIRVEGTQQRGGASFVVGGINYCFGQLRRRRGQPNKIVLLGDGNTNIGSSPVSRAQLFRDRLDGEVCVVGAGFPNNKELLAIAGGDESLVFEVNDFFDVLALEDVLEKMISQICGI